MYLVVLKPSHGEVEVIVREVPSDIDLKHVQEALDELGQTSCGDLIKDFAILMALASGDLEGGLEYQVQVYEVPDERAKEVRALLDQHSIQ